MSLSLSDSRYGRSGIRLLKLNRRGDRHDVRDLTVDVALEGDFAATHTEGDNRAILPTDSMQNAVYALARDHAGGEIEEFALELVRHFLADVQHAVRARVRVAQRPWGRIETGGRPHDFAFARGGAERRIATAEGGRDGRAPLVEAGIEGLLLMKTRGAGFAGYLKDRYTTLPETDDRILCAELNAVWRYGWPELPYAAHYRQVRQVILDTFAAHDSRSVQHTLFEMARAALEQVPPLIEVRLRLPSQPPRPVDLRPFGMENTGEVFLPSEEPRGLMEAVVRRDDLG